MKALRYFGFRAKPPVASTTPLRAGAPEPSGVQNRAGYGPLFLDEFCNWAFEEHRHVPFLDLNNDTRRFPLPTVAPASRRRSQIPQHYRHRMPKCAQRLVAPEQADDISLADHHPTHQHELGNRRAHTVEISAQHPPSKF